MLMAYCHRTEHRFLLEDITFIDGEGCCCIWQRNREESSWTLRPKKQEGEVLFALRPMLIP